jgi:hypothetical protein
MTFSKFAIRTPFPVLNQEHRNKYRPVIKTLVISKSCAVKHVHLEVLKWDRANGCEWSWKWGEVTCTNAARGRGRGRGGHSRTDVLVLGTHAETCTKCASCFGHLQVLQRASLNGGILLKEALLYAITGDQIEVLEWLVL